MLLFYAYHCSKTGIHFWMIRAIYKTRRAIYLSPQLKSSAFLAKITFL